MKIELQKLIQECQGIAGNWDGDESGYREDQAHIALEIVDDAKELIILINELNGTE